MSHHHDTHGAPTFAEPQTEYEADDLRPTRLLGPVLLLVAVCTLATFATVYTARALRPVLLVGLALLCGGDTLTPLTI